MAWIGGLGTGETPALGGDFAPLSKKG